MRVRESLVLQVFGMFAQTALVAERLLTFFDGAMMSVRAASVRVDFPSVSRKRTCCRRTRCIYNHGREEGAVLFLMSLWIRLSSSSLQKKKKKCIYEFAQGSHTSSLQRYSARLVCDISFLKGEKQPMRGEHIKQNKGK